MRKSSRSRPAGRRATRPDRLRLRRAARLFVEAIGDAELRRDLRRTPERVAAAWSRELLAGYGADPREILATSFAAPERDMVVVREIPFTSVCAHHLLPFHGRAQVAYLPAGRLAGLSKLVRALQALARRLQIQERLTRQMVDAMTSALRPRGAACRIDAEHLCMTARGAAARGSRVVTLAWSGAFARSAALRSEFLRAAAGEPRSRRERLRRRA